MAGRLLKDLLRHVQRLAPPGAGEGTDRQLVERFARQRDEAAFASLVHRHGSLVLGVGRRVLRHHQDAEDVFQATFLLLARQAASRRWQPSIAGWLYRVAYRLALRAGSQAVLRREVERSAGSLAVATRSEGRTELCTALDEELQRLSDQFREPLVLCYLEAKTRDQAARQLGWSLRTLERRLNQGLKLLRSRLEKRGVELPAALLTAELSRQSASATLIETTVEAAMTGELGAATGVGVLSPGVAALIEEGSKAMTMSTMMKTTFAVVLLLAMGTAAALVGSPREQQPAAKQADAQPPAAEGNKVAARVEETWPEGATVKGRVVDHWGAAVANAEVLLLGAERVIVESNRTWWVVGRGGNDQPKPPSVRTDAKGEFQVTRKKGAADRIVVISPALLFWSVSRKSLSTSSPVEVKLSAPGSLAIHCALPGKAAKQSLNIEMRDSGRESDTLRFHFGSHSVANPGERVFEHLPPGEYVVHRMIETPTGKNTMFTSQADRQLVKVEADKRATIHFERKVGRPLTGQVRGLEKVELRYGHVTISYFGPEERLPGGKTGRMMTTFDVLPIKSDGRFTTDPMPPGKYHLDLFVVRASTVGQSIQQSDFDGRLEFTVPERGDMPKVEIVAKPSTSRRPPNRDPRARLIDDNDALKK